jgi:heme exporter protein CcmD
MYAHTPCVSSAEVNMIESINEFLQMGGYGWYIWSAYSIVMVFLGLQWFIPWRHWQRYLREQKMRDRDT